LQSLPDYFHSGADLERSREPGTCSRQYNYSLSAIEATPINFNYLGIDSVQISIFSAGTQHPGYNQNTNQVAIENLNVDFLTTLAAVPEPSTWLAAALALGVIGFSQRKRLHAFRD
jgi:hypothetical protein